jgi:hypothetical protein
MLAMSVGLVLTRQNSTLGKGSVLVAVGLGVERQDKDTTSEMLSQ